jgi:hypothetical protein
VRQTKARSTVGAALAPQLQDWVFLHVFLLLHADSADIYIYTYKQFNEKLNEIKTKN